MRLFLVTHAETDWTLQRRFQGHTDIPLNECGRQQAQRLQERLAQEPLQAIISSDLSRARQTAEIIALPHGLLVQAEPRLRELNFGLWEGLTYDEVQQMDPHHLAAWQSNPVQASPTLGEPLTSLALRLQGALSDLLSRPDGNRLLVAHRGCLRVLLCLLLGINVAQHWDFHLDVASLTEVEIRAGKVHALWLSSFSARVQAQG